MTPTAKKTVLLVLVLTAFAQAAYAPPAAALSDADELIFKMRAAVAGLKSYSYTIRRKDAIDNAMAVRLENGFSTHKAVIDKFSKAFALNDAEVAEPEVDRKEKHYKSMFAYKFVKPFLMQMNLTRSDYLPPFITKADLLYRPDLDRTDFWLRISGTGMMMRREATEESGGFMAQNWEYLLMEMDCAMVNGGKKAVAGNEKVLERDTYVLEVALVDGRAPWAVGCGGSNYGAPVEIHPQINREFNMLATRIKEYGGGYIRYNVDAETFLIVQKEEIYNTTTAVLMLLDDITLNKLSADDLLAPDKSALKPAK